MEVVQIVPKDESPKDSAVNINEEDLAINVNKEEVDSESALESFRLLKDPTMLQIAPFLLFRGFSICL